MRAGRLTIAVFAVASAACGTSRGAAPPIVQPGAPGQESKVISAEKASDFSRVQFTAADVRFMQGMIGHHAQAVEMTALVPSRTASEDMRKLALRIEVSQADEIKMMKHWLAARGQDVPGPHAHHMDGATLMPGMLTAEEMAALAAREGARVRSPVPRGHDQAPRRRADDGAGAVRDAGRRPGVGDLRVRVGRGRRSADGNRSHGRNAQGAARDEMHRDALRSACACCVA